MYSYTKYWLDDGIQIDYFVNIFVYTFLNVDHSGVYHINYKLCI